MNGAAGDRFWVRVPSLVTTGCSSRIAAAWRVRGRLVGDVERLAVDADELRGERLAGGGREDRLDRPVLARREGPDLALALDDQADGDRLDAPRRQAALDLLAEQRAERVADEAVDDPARLLGVDEVHVDLARVREGLLDRRLGDLVEGHPAASWSSATCAASATCQAIASPSRSRSVAR